MALHDKTSLKFQNESFRDSERTGIYCPLELSYARRILQEHEEALTALHELSGNQRGLLRFGCGPHISVAVVPHLLRAFLAKYPGIEVRLITGNDPSLFDD